MKKDTFTNIYIHIYFILLDVCYKSKVLNPFSIIITYSWITCIDLLIMFSNNINLYRFLYSANLISVPGILYQILNDDVVEKKKKKKEVFEEFLQAERLPPGSKIEKKERENPRISFITVI